MSFGLTKLVDGVIRMYLTLSLSIPRFPSPRRRTKATPLGSHRSTNHRHATQQNEKFNSRHAQHRRLSWHVIEDCFTVRMPPK
ncbi:hypothetical protein TNCV_3426301 [Trichonephila clavipes]|nr:hypothetical protein TNCV_3426301 [Trichonephila clavipes]